MEKKWQANTTTTTRQKKKKVPPSPTLLPQQPPLCPCQLSAAHVPWRRWRQWQRQQQLCTYPRPTYIQKRNFSVPCYDSVSCLLACFGCLYSGTGDASWVEVEVECVYASLSDKTTRHSGCDMAMARHFDYKFLVIVTVMPPRLSSQMAPSPSPSLPPFHPSSSYVLLFFLASLAPTTVVSTVYVLRKASNSDACGIRHPNEKGKT